MKVFHREKIYPLQLTVNRQSRKGHCEPRVLLSDFLRHDLGMTGVHVGCEHGVCGACTVNIDGIPQRSCLVLALSCEGKEIETIEGLTEHSDSNLTDLQEAFRRNFALQCGFCTPGILISSHNFLEKKPNPTEREVREMLSGHLCRCTGYTGIVRAILEVASERRKNN